MDTYSSGEEPLVKNRKPYTITKQRERWTEEEHNRFLEALKLYGRAWQRIEEHIGTKSAVQIRSHAQKFFTKLEKESFIKGVPIGHAHNIDIPPPRPKRKPSNPYPRKTNVGMMEGKLSTSLSSLCQDEITLDLENKPFSKKQCDAGNKGNTTRYLENGNFPDVLLSPLEKAARANPSSTSKKSSSASVAPTSSCTSRDYDVLSTEASNQDETMESQVTFDAKQLQTDTSCNKILNGEVSFNSSNNGDLNLSHEKQEHDKSIDELKQSNNTNILPTTNMQASQNYPFHVPVHILDGRIGMSSQNVVSDKLIADSVLLKMDGVHGHPYVLMNPAVSASSEHHCSSPTSSILQSLPNFLPVPATIPNQDDHQSFLHLSSTFSRLIVSALLQNPAAHSAANFVTMSWPWVAMEAQAESSNGGIQSRQINMSSSGMAPIAAATVAAANAWWAANGLLPLCSSFHPGCTCSGLSASATPVDINHNIAANNARNQNQSDIALESQLKPECLEAFQEQHLGSRSPALLSSDSEASKGAKSDSALAAAEATQMADVVELLDANKFKSRKQVDRSSCGSNTSSSSEVEADGLEKYKSAEERKLVKDKESKAIDENHPVGDPFSRRSLCNINDSWKEVSEEGRLAFQALFSREILPQSFSQRDFNDRGEKGDGKGENNTEEKAVRRLELDLNNKICGSSSQKQVENDSFLNGVNNQGPPNVEFGRTKLKPFRTGFKPYKRCSLEAKEKRISVNNSQDEENGPKRVRIGEKST